MGALVADQLAGQLVGRLVGGLVGGPAHAVRGHAVAGEPVPHQAGQAAAAWSRPGGHLLDEVEAHPHPGGGQGRGPNGTVAGTSRAQRGLGRIQVGLRALEATAARRRLRHGHGGLRRGRRTHRGRGEVSVEVVWMVPSVYPL